MNELIKINANSDRPTVSGRELHDALGVNSNYTTWFNRMCEYGFTENQDYATCFPNLESENQHGGQNKIDHQLTIEMAKELCMLQRNEKGKFYRQYFIDIENKWNSPEYIMARALQMANRQLECLKSENTELKNKIETDKPKVILGEAITESPSSIHIGTLAKILAQNGVKNIGQNRLFEKLRQDGYLIKEKGSRYNTPTQYAMELKLFEIKENVIKVNGKSDRINTTTMVTGKGQKYFINMFLDKGKNKAKEPQLISV